MKRFLSLKIKRQFCLLAEAAVVRVSIKWVASVVEKGSIEVADMG